MNQPLVGVGGLGVIMILFGCPSDFCQALRLIRRSLLGGMGGESGAQEQQRPNYFAPVHDEKCSSQGQNLAMVS
jgi:hypothetical protein